MWGISRVASEAVYMSNLINSWSEVVGFSSSTAQFMMEGVSEGEEKVRSRTEEP